LNPLSLLALAAALFIFAATPGPGVFATLARALASGFRPACAVIVGIVIGDIIFLLLAIFGLSAIAGVLGELFLVIKIAGGAYLIWLGCQIWAAKPEIPEVGGYAPQISWFRNLISGLAITLSNPKTILFYMGFLPTFMDLFRLSGRDIVIVTVIVATVVAGVLIGYAYTASRARALFHDPKAVRILNRSAGTIMAATGLILVGKS
jgi:threonine/homoserine/homoserine lactone efflux protein